MLIVGLGNPGKEYEWSRHNLGFMVIDKLAHDEGIVVSRRECSALVGRAQLEGVRTKLAKPQTFMNLSGHAVSCLLAKIESETPINQLVVISDDLALPLGKIRIRERGTAGGHNGLKSIIQSLATQAFPRMRVGVGRGDNRRDLADHVLGRFEADERDTVSAAVLRAADATEMFLSDGIERVMNAFNAADKEDVAE